MRLKKAWMMFLAAVVCTGGFVSYGNVNYVMAESVEGVQTQLEIPGTIRNEKAYDESFLSVTGFASVDGAIKDRTEYIGTEQYREVTNEREFLQALLDAQTGAVKVIELKADLNLGYTELGLTSEEARTFNIAKYGNPTNGFTNPEIEASGVSKLNISDTDGLTIFSKEGHTIKHVEIKIQSSSSDIVLRNLNFDGMWQWDDTGKHKEVGWSFIKVNGANNVWIDHCSFTHAADGMLDMENGASGVTLSWCTFGVEADENPSPESMIYKSITHMEERYENGELGETSRYRILRDKGMTMNQIMAYTAYHSKTHLVGSGDKDYKNYVNSSGRDYLDGNQRLSLTMAYCHYKNVGQRVPMIRQGKGHLFNTYIDDSSHMDLQNNEAIFNEFGGYTLSRGINSRNGASIAADTCVFEGVQEPLIGSEKQGDDTNNMNAPWDELFQNAENQSLIVNSSITNKNGSYTGSSWDNNGENLFTVGFNWDDKSTIGKWAWSSSIVGVEDMKKDQPPAEPFEFTYNYDEVLPYEYNVVPLEDVVSVVTSNAGAGMLQLTEEEWLKTDYTADNESGEEQKTYAVTMQGKDKVKAGEAFSINISIDQVVDPVYAQDLVVAYDPSVVTFVGADGIDPTMVLEAQDNGSGQARILAATENGVEVAQDIVELKFQVKSDVASGKSLVEVKDIILGTVVEGVSSSVEVEGIQKELSIVSAEESVDTSRLEAIIEEATKLYDEAVVGTEEGQYPAEAKEAFSLAIEKAKEAVASVTTVGELERAIDDLNEAIRVFKESVVAQDKEDTNNDGVVNVADLATVAYYYRAAEGDANWDEAKKADINQDGRVSIEDLVVLAKRILNN